MKNRRLIIAMDGPAGSGKSTVAQKLAERLGYLYLNSGSMYRAMTFLSLREHIPPTDVQGLIALAKTCRIDFANNGKTTLLNGEDVSDALRTPEVERIIADIARIPAIRKEMVKQQRRIAESGAIIVEGRDVTTVVFPDADVKFYVTASVEERARRRYLEQKQKGIQTTQAEVEADIRHRDNTDHSRADSPLRRADDAILVDTTGIPIDAVVDYMLERIATL